MRSECDGNLAEQEGERQACRRNGNWLRINRDGQDEQDKKRKKNRFKLLSFFFHLAHPVYPCLNSFE
ncbi:MAG: hypothetical protein DMF68_17790 [Acidobacteria bacterium]|nr:MAG: hypothetical protein DMF68_17790 [Acidobacteriota bacterium]